MSFRNMIYEDWISKGYEGDFEEWLRGVIKDGVALEINGRTFICVTFPNGDKVQYSGVLV